jgi:hypothetical protein
MTSHDKNDSVVASLPELPQGYTRSLILTLSPRYIVWLPPLFLTVALLSTFFPWVGMYLGDTAAYTQSPWGAVVGRVSSNPPLVNAVRWPNGWLNQVRSDWLILLPALLLLSVTTGLAWLVTVHRWLPWRQFSLLETIWPWRGPILLGLTTGATILFFLQCTNGFGMERGLRVFVQQQLPNDGDSSGSHVISQDIMQYRVEQEIQRYNLGYTLWQRTALGCLVLALLNEVLQLLLEYRGQRPPPRFIIQW